MSRFVVCLTTVGSLPVAERIARHLVRKRLVACANVIPGLVSFYHWQGKLCRDKEFLLLVKTLRSRVASLERELRSVHPYELPEFIVLPISGGSRRYLEWLSKSSRS